MNKLILSISVLLISVSANADTWGSVFVNSRKTEAKLLINENMKDGDVSQFFDQMKVPETGNATQKTKTFALKSGRFTGTCFKGLFTNQPPTTNCVFIIKQGTNSADITTTISKSGNQSEASLNISSIISAELAGIFPADANNAISFVLNTSTNNVSFEVQGSTSGTMTIGFSAK